MLSAYCCLLLLVAVAWARPDHSRYHHVQEPSTPAVQQDRHHAADPGRHDGKRKNIPAVTPQMYHDVIEKLPLLKLFDLGTFQTCDNEFFFNCHPQLLETQQQQFHQRELACETEFCACTGSTESRHCRAIDCDGKTRCESNRMRCYGRDLYPVLTTTTACKAFAKCTTRTAVRSEEQFNCHDQLVLSAPECQSSDDKLAACSYVNNPQGPDVQKGTTPVAPHEAPKDKSLPVAYRVFVTALVTAGIVLVILLVIGVYSRLRRRHVVRGTAQPVQIQVRIAQPVRWFGIGQLLKSAPEGFFSSKKDASVVTIPTCAITSCGSNFDHSSARRMLLPCRCEWCGCDKFSGRSSSPRKDSHLPDFNPDARVRAYPGLTTVRTDTTSGAKDMATYACLTCSTPIEMIIDIRNLYVETGSTSARSDDSMNSTGTPKCCVCLTNYVNVVSLPCSHLATCSECANRLCKAVPRRGADPASVEVSSKCPVCRTSTEAMVVLDDDQVRDAVESARAE